MIYSFIHSGCSPSPRSFDDVIRIVAPPPETKKTTVELDDKKSSKGLGELYEEEYQRAVTGVSEDKVRIFF